MVTGKGLFCNNRGLFTYLFIYMYNKVIICLDGYVLSSMSGVPIVFVFGVGEEDLFMVG